MPTFRINILKLMVFLAPLTVSEAYASDYQQLPGIVRVASVYADFAAPAEAPRTERVEGTGFVVDVEDLGLKAVITAAHVASGDVQPTQSNASVSWFNPARQTFQEERVQFRFLMAGWDVAVLLVDAPDMPALATLSKNDLLLLTSTANELYSSANAGVMAHLYRAGRVTYLPLIYDYLTPALSPLSSLSDDALTTLTAKATPALRTILEVGFDPGDFEYSALVPLAPGMSGAPLIAPAGKLDDHPHAKFITGMAGADSRYFTKSWFVPAAYIASGIRQMLSYIQGQTRDDVAQLPWRYNIDHVFWRDFDGLLLRTGSIPRLDIAYREIVLDKTLRGEVGNGTRVDVGNGDETAAKHDAAIRALSPGTAFHSPGYDLANVLAYSLSYGGRSKIVAANTGGTQAVVAMNGLKSQGDAQFTDLVTTPIAATDPQLPALLLTNLQRRFGCTGEALVTCRIEGEQALPLSGIRPSTLVLTASLRGDQLALTLATEGHEAAVALSFGADQSSGTKYMPVLTLGGMTVDVEELLFDSYDSARQHVSFKISDREYWFYVQ